MTKGDDRPGNGCLIEQRKGAPSPTGVNAMRRNLTVVIAALCVAVCFSEAGCSGKQAGGIYDDFTEFCIRHIDDEKTAVDDALKNGWRPMPPHEQNRSENSNSKAWKIGDYKFSKGRGDNMKTLHFEQWLVFTPGHPNIVTNNCTVAARADSNELARIVGWANVKLGDVVRGVQVYTFIDEGGKHVPVPSNRDDLIMANGGGRRLEILSKGNLAAATLFGVNQ